MKVLFDQVSFECSAKVTKKYSTSFSLATKMLDPKIRSHIYNIYGFVRFADEIVDSFHSYDKEQLLNDFHKEYYVAYDNSISLNPIMNSFIITTKKFNIERELVDTFINSMRRDLHQTHYDSFEDYKNYIYGSADVVGLMCLKVFVNGDQDEFDRLKYFAMKLGSAFQKVNFLRDIKEDYELLNRSYFPHLNLKELSIEEKQKIIQEIEADFKEAYQGIIQLPLNSRFGVYTAYRYYKKLLKKLDQTPFDQILTKRIRVSNAVKINLLARSFVRYKLNLL